MKHARRRAPLGRVDDDQRGSPILIRLLERDTTLATVTSTALHAGPGLLLGSEPPPVLLLVARKVDPAAEALRRSSSDRGIHADMVARPIGCLGLIATPRGSAGEPPVAGVVSCAGVSP